MNREEYRAVRWLHIRSGVFLQSGYLQQSMACLLMALELAPENCAVLRSLAVVCLRMGQAERAQRISLRLEQLEGASALSCLVRARSHWLLGNEAEAGAAMEEFNIRKDAGEQN